MATRTYYSIRPVPSSMMFGTLQGNGESRWLRSTKTTFCISCCDFDVSVGALPPLTTRSHAINLIPERSARRPLSSRASDGEFCDGKEDLAPRTYAWFEPLESHPRGHWFRGCRLGSAGLAERSDQRNAHWPLRADVPTSDSRNRIPRFPPWLGSSAKIRYIWVRTRIDIFTVRVARSSLRRSVQSLASGYRTEQRIQD